MVENAGEGSETVFASVSYTLSANVEILSLAGGTGISATGNAGANTLYGNVLDNVLDGVAGADTLIGGAGNDTYYVDNAGDAVVENAGEGSDTVFAGVSYALSANVEVLSLASGNGISAAGNAGANTLYGNALDNVLDGGAGADSLSGGSGSDWAS